jgi:hypothetical protein
MLRACGFYCFERAIPELASFAKISSDQKEIAFQVLCPKGKVRKFRSSSPIHANHPHRRYRNSFSIRAIRRPIHHRLEGRMRAHVFLCMLAYYLEWHMRKALAPMLFGDDGPRQAREDVVSPLLSFT